MLNANDLIPLVQSGFRTGAPSDSDLFSAGSKDEHATQNLEPGSKNQLYIQVHILVTPRWPS